MERKMNDKGTKEENVKRYWDNCPRGFLNQGQLSHGQLSNDDNCPSEFCSRETIVPGDFLVNACIFSVCTNMLSFVNLFLC